MTRRLRYYLLTLWDLLTSFGPFVLLPLLLVGLAYWWLNPAPPHHLRLATGPAQSAYAAFGERYAQALKKEGIHVELVPTEGSRANLALLSQAQVDMGFVQGGTASAVQDDDETLQSLGGLFVEPVWVFYRRALITQHPQRGPLNKLSQLKGLRVNLGEPGSGVPALMNELLKANDLTLKDLHPSYLAQTPATVAFLAGQLDALVFVSAPESSMVQLLLQAPGVALLDFVQSEAYARRFPYLTPVTLPRGVVNLAQDVPRRDTELVASTTSLLVRPETHPALQQLFAQAALTLHGMPGWFNRAGEFPNLKHNEVEISAEAQRAYTEGASMLQRHLPFWLANVLQRMALALGLIVAVVLPLSRVVPPLYAFRIRSRVFRWYGRLREIETQIDSGESSPAALQADLDQVEQRVGTIHLPLSYTDELYALKSHIRWVRQRLQTPGGAAAGPNDPSA